MYTNKLTDNNHFMLYRPGSSDFRSFFHSTAQIQQQIATSCGGTILSSVLILTAVHCVYTIQNHIDAPESLKIIAGDNVNREMFNTETSGQIRTVKKIIVHPSYNHSNAANDIAILILAKPLEFNAEVGNIIYSVSYPLDLTGTFLRFMRI